MMDKICEYCKVSFIPKRKSHNRGRFCSRKCFRENRRINPRMADCHPAKKHVGRGLCLNCLAKKTYRLHRYGLSELEYDNMLEQQNGVCAICGERETLKYRGEIKPLSVDHDHATNNVRGLLCDDCNNGLGRFKDDIVKLEKAIQYLRLFENVTYGFLQK